MVHYIDFSSGDYFALKIDTVQDKVTGPARHYFLLYLAKRQTSDWRPNTVTSQQTAGKHPQLRVT